MSRFQFVADNSATFEVKRLCELVEIERSSYYAWLKAAPAREARAADDAALAELSGSERSMPRTTLRARRGSPPSSTLNSATARLSVSGSTTSASRG